MHEERCYDAGSVYTTSVVSSMPRNVQQAENKAQLYKSVRQQVKKNSSGDSAMPSHKKDDNGGTSFGAAPDEDDEAEYDTNDWPHCALTRLTALVTIVWLRVVVLLIEEV